MKMGLLILRLILAFTTFVPIVLCQSTYTATVYGCSTSYQTTPTVPVPTTQIFTTQHVTLTSTMTSGTTTTTLALGLPTKVTSTTVVTSTTTITAPTQTQTVTVAAGAEIVTVTPSATTVSSTSELYVSGSTSATTITPSVITITSTSVASGTEATLTITTTLVQNNKRQVPVADPPTRRHERRAGIYQKEVYCVHDVAIGTIITSTTYLHTSVKYAPLTVTSTTTLTRLVDQTTTPTSKTTITSTPPPSTVTAATPTATTTIYATSTITAAVVTVTASPSTTTDVIVSTSTPSPTTITITVTLTSSTPTTTPTTASTAPNCTVIIPDYGTNPDDTHDSYVLYYNSSGYIENLDNPGNERPEEYPPIYTDYAGTLDDVCTVARMCADQADLVDIGDYYSFDLHFLQSNQSWVCVQFIDNNGDPSYFNVPDDDAIAVYGYNYVNVP